MFLQISIYDRTWSYMVEACVDTIYMLWLSYNDLYMLFKDVHVHTNQQILES